MIELSTTWQQIAQALEHEDFEAAYAVLDGAYGESDKRGRARLSLLAASVHSLYGDAGAGDARQALNEAARLDPTLREDALQRALHAELVARETPDQAAELARSASHSPMLLKLPGEAALTRYHLLVTLSIAEQPEQALDAAPAAGDVPPHLRWRLRSWQADCEEQLGHHEEAAHLYAEAAHLASSLNRAIMLQEQAAVLLQVERAEEARRVLERARSEYVGAEDEGLHLAAWHSLSAQAELALGDTRAALTAVAEASRLERAHGDPSSGVELVWGQVLVALERFDEAMEHFGESLRLSNPEDRAYALHEMGVAYLDGDRPLEARERLLETLAHPEYPYLPEVHADLAEAEYRLGRLQEAEASAQQALSQGATVPASLVLGSVALDYYRLDEALEHYRRVIEGAAGGSPEWVTAHQMAADVLAQQGFREPAIIQHHASLALEHTDRSDEWYATLLGYLERAEKELRGGGQRTLN